MEKKKPQIPLGELISTDRNMYEVTNAAIHRAKQISVTGTDDLEPGQGKIVSMAIKEIVTGEVEYSYKE